MNFILPKTPWLLKRSFQKFHWEVPTSERKLYLTFDDGPTPEITQETLEILEAHNAKATFFCIGNNVEKHPDTLQKVAAKGHAIGNHTHNHLNGWKTDNKLYVDNTLQAEDQLAAFSVNPDRLFRPPYGKISPKQGKLLRSKGYQIVMWDVVTIDWLPETSPEQCLQYVLEYAKAGSIVVFHDSVKASKNMLYALPRVLDHFSEKGYTFEKISADILASNQ